MKKTILFLVMAVALTTSTLFAQVPSYIPTNGLVGYWPFNGNANDASGNGNNGSYTGLSCGFCGNTTVTAPPTLTTDRYNIDNSSMNFTNQLDLISIPNNNLLQLTSNYTISLWLNPSSIDFESYTWGVILAKWGDAGSASYQLRLSNTGKLIYDTHDGVVTTSLLSNSSLPLNTWTHVVIKQVNSEVTIILNSVSDASSSTMVVPAVVNNSIEIGRNLNQFSNYTYEGFIGKIDDITIYNRVISQEEIIGLYNAEILCQSLVINTGILSFNPPTYQNTVTIYPNPANDQITIDCGNLANVQGWSIKITNMLGQEVFNAPMATQQYSIALNSWTGQGMYFVKIINAQNEVVNIKKIILQ